MIRKSVLTRMLVFNLLGWMSFLGYSTTGASVAPALVLENIHDFVSFAGPLGGRFGDLYHSEDLPASSAIEGMYLECRSSQQFKGPASVQVNSVTVDYQPEGMMVTDRELATSPVFYYFYDISSVVSDLQSLKDIKVKLGGNAYCQGRAFYKKTSGTGAGVNNKKVFVYPQLETNNVAPGQYRDLRIEMGIDELSDRHLAVSVDFSLALHAGHSSSYFYLNGNPQELKDLKVHGQMTSVSASPVDVSSSLVEFETKKATTTDGITFITFTIFYNQGPEVDPCEEAKKKCMFKALPISKYNTEPFSLKHSWRPVPFAKMSGADSFKLFWAHANNGCSFIDRVNGKEAACSSMPKTGDKYSGNQFKLFQVFGIWGIGHEVFKSDKLLEGAEGKCVKLSMTSLGGIDKGSGQFKSYNEGNMPDNACVVFEIAKLT
eukprot:Nk52_evm2s251 gene=Nk52_evmTU2s251